VSGDRDHSRWAERFEAARAIVGYDAGDEWRVLLTRELVVARASIFAAEMEPALLSRRSAAGASADDAQRSSSRQTELLQSWISALDGPFRREAALSVAEFARTYTTRGGDLNMQVKARYLLAAFAVLQAAIGALLFEYIGDAAELQATISAWNKLLMLHLDVVLATYGGLAPGPHWY
jgi:hypothetical protein